MRRLWRILASRAFLIAILLLLQISFLFMWAYRTALYYSILPAIDLIALFVAIYVVNKDEDNQYKIGWIFLILGLPVIGTLLFLLCFGRKMPKRLANGTIAANERMRGLLCQDDAVIEELRQEAPSPFREFYSGVYREGFPVYRNTDVKVYDSGEEFFPDLLDALSQARKFIFLEYYIINPGRMWDSVLEVLRRKVEEGVEVKLIYDDFGCIRYLPRRYHRLLNEYGIETYQFNRMRPALLVTMNNRDHRKLCIIDNEIGFTGGINLSDEYINETHPYGYWRDSACRLSGEAVQTMTVMFLGMFSYLRKDEALIDYTRYLQKTSVPGREGCYYQPFSDTPTDDTDTGLNVHLNLVANARRYIYIDTPYLVLNSDMRTALCLAAYNGVDVRIMTPHVPDKKAVFEITCSNYEKLIKGGVRIFEYKPGFNHRKNYVADDEMCLVSSINSDYRSYYLQFESGVLMRDEKTAVQMRQEFEKGLEECVEITMDDCMSVGILRRGFRSILALLAPLF